MSNHRWQGYTHPELFRQIHDGPGAEASTASVRRWEALNQALSDIDAQLSTALARAAEGWHGEAADSAGQNGVRPLGQWAVNAQQAAELMRDRAQQQADFISKARADMPPPETAHAEQPGFGETLLTHLFGGQTDYEVQEAKQHAAEQRAFEVMRTYEVSTVANTTSLASFTAPPQVVVDAPPGPAPGSAGTAGWSPVVTISWGPAAGKAAGPAAGGDVGPAAGSRGRAATGGSRAGGGGSARGSGRATASEGASGDAPERAPGGEAPAARAGSAAGAVRPVDRRSTEEADGGQPSVTEHVGQPGGFFDDQQTLSRPVIGGEPG